MPLIQYFETNGRVFIDGDNLVVVSDQDISTTLRKMFFYCNTRIEKERSMVKSIMGVFWKFPFFYKVRSANAKNAVQSVSPTMNYHLSIPKNHLKNRWASFYRLVGVLVILIVLMVCILIFRFYVIW